MAPRQSGDLTTRGLCLESCELLTWTELFPDFARINEATTPHLVVFSAVVDQTLGGVRVL
jgi:hypothetical protein